MSIDVISCLCNPEKLKRDAGLVELQRVFPNLDKNSRCKIHKSLLHALNDEGSPWEAKLGCLLGVKFILPSINLDCERESEFARNILTIAQKILSGQEEARIQLAAGEVLGALSSKIGPSIYQECRALVLRLIQQGLSKQDECLEMERLTSASQRRSSGDVPNVGLLEANIRALQAIVDGCGGGFAPHIEEGLLEILTGALEHKNQGVREAAFYLSASVASSCAEAEHRGDIIETGIIFDLGQTLVAKFAEGLTDEWSPVRLAASVAVRRFLLALPNDKTRQAFYPSLLPRMCLNRYYAAEGVRIYSQETWRQVAGSAGKELVQHHLPTIVEFYSQSTQSTSHAVREASCACIAELATKLQPDSVRPYVAQLLRTLLHCFHDDSWPVRDAACLACGNFVLNFPAQSDEILPELYPMFFHNLEDAIPSVRAGAAVALGSVVRAHGEGALAPVLSKVREGLQGLAQQPSDGADLIRSKQSVCSVMTPRLGRAGSTDHRFHRASQPWELADGCVSLVSELASVPLISPHLAPVLPLLAEVCKHRHYTAHLNFLETLCKHLPTIAKGVGKKTFKINLESFFEPVFYALESENALTSSAASQCLNQLSTFLGPNILRARLQAHSPSHVRHLDANLFIAPF